MAVVIFTMYFMKEVNSVKPNWKVIGVLATITGGAMTLLSQFVEEKQRDEVIKEEVRKALAEQNEEGESE